MGGGLTPKNLRWLNHCSEDRHVGDMRTRSNIHNTWHAHKLIDTY